MGKGFYKTAIPLILLTLLLVFTSCDGATTISSRTQTATTTSALTPTPTTIAITVEPLPKEPDDFIAWAEQAINWAMEREKEQDWNKDGYCLQFVADCFIQEKYVAAGKGSAIIAFNDYKESGLAVNAVSWLKAPRGALIFFGPNSSNGNGGHVAIYLGDGRIIHTPGSQAKTDILEEVVKKKGVYDYIGWGFPPEEWRPIPLPVYPGTFELPSPIYSLTPIFQWKNSLDVENYGIYIRDIATDTIIFDSVDRNIHITGLAYKIPPGVLEWGKEYRWNMNAKYAGTWTEYSDRYSFHTAIKPAALTTPIVVYFSANRDSLKYGELIGFYCEVYDNSGLGLKQIELWEGTDTDEDGKPNWPESNTGYVDIQYVSGNTAEGFFEYAPQKTGVYWYGVHVVDNAGNWNDENNSNSNRFPGVFGPLRIIVE